MAWTSESVPSTGSNWTSEIVPSFIGWATETTSSTAWKHTGHFGWAITSTETGSFTYNTSFTITVTFDEPVIDFDLTDFSTINCVISNLAGSGKVYTATCTKSYYGQITVAILASRVTDDKGNKNSIGTLFSIDVRPSIFKSSWTLSGVERTIKLPLVSGGTYEFDIDWGDGNTDTITTWNQVLAGETDPVTHTYDGNGVKEMEIGGASNYTITGWKFDNTGDKLKIRDISDWGPLNISTDDVFYGCSNLNVTATNAPTISATDLSNCFSGCTSLTSIGGDWDVSSVRIMQNMFGNASSFNQDISNWDVSSVTDMSWMFADAETFNQPLAAWGAKTSNVTNMSYMFFQAFDFDQPIEAWDVRKVTTFVAMFQGFWNNQTIFNQDLSDWDTAAAITMNNMFLNSGTFTGDGVSSFDIEEVTTMARMFEMQSGSTALTTANYDAMLIAWNGDPHQDNVSLHAGDAVMTTEGPAEAARDALVANGWIIIDSTGTHTS